MMLIMELKLAVENSLIFTVVGAATRSGHDSGLVGRVSAKDRVGL